MSYTHSAVLRFTAFMFLLGATSLVQAATYAEDRAEIENLMSVYIYALDLKDPAAYVGTFTEDGVLNHAGGIERGHAAIRAFIENSAANARRAWENRYTSKPRPIPNRHLIDNLELDINGDTARGRAYWTSMSVDENRQPHISEYGFYEDEYRRVNGKWLFSSRLIVNEFRSGREYGVVSAE